MLFRKIANSIAIKRKYKRFINWKIYANTGSSHVINNKIGECLINDLHNHRRQKTPICCSE